MKSYICDFIEYSNVRIFVKGAVRTHEGVASTSKVSVQFCKVVSHRVHRFGSKPESELKKINSPGTSGQSQLEFHLPQNAMPTVFNE